MLMLASALSCGMACPAADGPSATVRLLSGEKFVGTVLNTNFTWRTPYANVSLDPAMISVLELLPQPDASQRLVSVNQDRLSGLLEEDLLLLRTADGKETSIRRETIADVTFALRPGTRADSESAMTLRFRNGDVLRGWLAEDSLPIIVAEGESARNQVPLSNVLSMVIAPVRDAVIRQKDGSELRGRIDSEMLLLRLAIGPSIAVHPASLQSVESREAVELRSSSARRDGLVGPHGLTLVWIPPGEFVMGSSQEEPGRDLDEGPQTRVRIAEGFWIGKHEVTQGQFQQVVGANPSSGGGTNLPVEKVNWLEAMEFCRSLSRVAEGAGNLPDGFEFRLPTEAEWEYACRAGAQTRFSHGDDPNGSELERFAWFTRNGESTTHPVGTKEPNPWGLHDMHGNVWEWCLDRWEGGLPGGSITNRAVKSEGNLRVARGGSWLYEARACRSANRDDYSAWNRCGDVGFRVVLAPVGK
jgi:formylglycine-generating enzyme required for sulfatase activity